MSARVEERPRVRLAEDRIAGPRVVALIAASVAVTAGSVLWTWLLLRLEEAPAPTVPPVTVRPAPPADILATPIDTDRAGQRARARDRAVLESYAWVDRERGIVRIPIERAMDIVTRTASEAPR